MAKPNNPKKNEGTPASEGNGYQAYILDGLVYVYRLNVKTKTLALQVSPGKKKDTWIPTLHGQPRGKEFTATQANVVVKAREYAELLDKPAAEEPATAGENTTQTREEA